MAQIRFEGVKKSFRDTLVLEHLNLTINNGEFFTFLGPSGCGKSTILNIIAGLEPVTAGSVYFDDTLVNDLPPRQRDVAMVFQSYALYPHMTVFENLAFPLRVRGVAAEAVEKEVKRVAVMLGIDALLQRKPASLSGGQRQRVAFGRAIIRKPKVFLMDEPLSNVDARMRVEMRRELKKLHSELGVTTVYVTHDQAEAMGLSDRIAVIFAGRVQQCATPIDLYLRPENMFVAGFVGSPPINFIPGIVKKVNPIAIACNEAIFSPSVEKVSAQENVILGIRPEDIKIGRRSSEKAIPASVIMVEPAGSFNWVDVDWGGVKIKGVGEVHETIGVGDKVFMEFREERLLVFDKQTERRL